MAVYKNIAGNQRESSESFGDFSITDATTVGHSIISEGYDNDIMGASPSKAGPTLKRLNAGSNITFSDTTEQITINADLSSIPSLPTGNYGQTLTYNSSDELVSTNQIRNQVGHTIIRDYNHDGDFFLAVSAESLTGTNKSTVQLISANATDTGTLAIAATTTGCYIYATGSGNNPSSGKLTLYADNITLYNNTLTTNQLLALDANKKIVTIPIPSPPTVPILTTSLLLAHNDIKGLDSTAYTLISGVPNKIINVISLSYKYTRIDANFAGAGVSDLFCYHDNGVNQDRVIEGISVDGSSPIYGTLPAGPCVVSGSDSNIIGVPLKITSGGAIDNNSANGTLVININYTLDSY